MNLFLKNKDSELEGLDEFDRLQREFLRFFDVGLDRRGLYDRAAAPAVDLLESPEGFEIRVDLPGVQKKDLELSLENNVLTVSGEKKESGDAASCYRRETWSGSFRRTLALPQGADGEKVKAELKDGVLTVTVGKREEVKSRQIAVSAR